jgi:hypothetical protein
VLDIWTAGYITFRPELDRLGVDPVPRDAAPSTRATTGG